MKTNTISYVNIVTHKVWSWVFFSEKDITVWLEVGFIEGFCQIFEAQHSFFHASFTSNPVYKHTRTHTQLSQLVVLKF